MRPGAPGQLQLNPFKVRTVSAGLGKMGKMPRVSGLYPGRPMQMPGIGKMGPIMGGFGMPKMPGGMGMPKMPMMGGGIKGY